MNNQLEKCPKCGGVAVKLDGQYECATCGHSYPWKSPKPIGQKNYGSIGHLPNSRMGEGDHKVPDGMDKICTVETRDKHDTIIVQEKLDGSNVGVAMVDGEIYPLTRAGYIANTSPYKQHHVFYDWVIENKERFESILCEGERIVGEWLYQAHGTKYDLPHEPFVAFDIMEKSKRSTYSDFYNRVRGTFIIPHLVHVGGAISVEEVMNKLGEYGHHGALDKIEGAVWRVERNNLIDKKKGGERRAEVDFLAKFVRPDKEDGCYLESVTFSGPVINNFVSRHSQTD